MANVAVTVRISAPLPVSTRDFPKLEKLACAAAALHGVDPATIKMGNDGLSLVMTYELKAR